MITRADIWEAMTLSRTRRVVACVVETSAGPKVRELDAQVGDQTADGQVVARVEPPPVARPLEVA